MTAAVADGGPKSTGSPPSVDTKSLEDVVKDAQDRVERQSKISIGANADSTILALKSDAGIKVINTSGNQPGKLQPPNN